MKDRNYPYVIQKRIESSIKCETWQTVTALLDYDTAHQFLSEVEIDPEGNYRIFFDAPDLMHMNAICREISYGHV